MRKLSSIYFVLSSAVSVFSFHSQVNATYRLDAPSIHHAAQDSPKTPVTAAVRQTFEPFTGRVTKNKVRVRLQPSFDGYVLREVNRDDLVVVKGEAEDFYAIQPPAGIKAYIFRTFVLDNTIEGTHVNVRLKPDLEAPVVAQLNSGDRVTGTVSSSSSKWLEIDLPESVRFYVSKDYIDKMGDAGLMARLEKRKEEAKNLLLTAQTTGESEMQKPFDQININPIAAEYQRIVNDYQDFPEFTSRAKQALTALQEAYLAKKIAYLESQSQHSSDVFENQNQQLNQELQAHKARIAYLEQQVQKDKAVNRIPASDKPSTPEYPVNMSAWFPVEDAFFNTWSKQTGSVSLDNFYREQEEKAFVLKGIVEPYNRPVKNRPGDYMLVSSSGKMPISFLYSTRVNLQDYVGREVSIIVSPRPNNHYAFPAYFVLSIE